MNAPQFNAFRLVGGTALSLQIGHRISVDIDLFTDATYGTVDFEAIEHFFRLHYPYVDTTSGVIGLGTSYFVGQDDQNAVKVDIYYTDPFI
jgi:predicted nucleotidyltransferase